MSDPDNVGTFGVVGNTITYSVGEGSPLCDTDQGLVGEVELISPGELRETVSRGRMHFHGGAQFSWVQGSTANYIDTKPPPRPPPDADSPAAAFEVEGSGSYKQRPTCSISPKAAATNWMTRVSSTSTRPTPGHTNWALRC